MSTFASGAQRRHENGTPWRGGRTRRLAIALVAALLLVGVSAGAFVSFAGAAAFVFVPDQGGENDIDTSSLSNQSDLSALGVLGNQYGWKWDEAALAGGNTQDVCAYFSTNGADGTAERAICYQVVSDSAGNVASENLTYWECPPGSYSTNKPPGGQKCTGAASPVADLSATRALSLNVQPSFPFDPDLDSQVVLTVTTALDLTLVNICTKSGSSPSSSSKDCGLEEPPAFLKLRKVVENGAATPGDFTLSWDGPLTNDGSVAGDNTEFVPVPPGSYTLSETGPSTYALTSLVCVDAANANVPVSSGVVTLAGNAEVTCTFSNRLIPAPALNVVKSVTSSGPYDSVGDVITYSIMVTNTGNETLTGVTVSDPGVGAVLGACTPPIPATLAPNVSVVCAATHAVTQADIDAGSYTNTAIGDSNETPSDSDDETVPVTKNPALSLDKTASPSSYDSVGDVVDYSYLVTNTGNLRLPGPVTVADDKASVSCPSVNTVGNLDSFLDPREVVTCSASYAVTQADLNAGSVTNTAKASVGGIDSNEDKATVEAVQSPAISLVKSAAEESFAAVEDVLHYTLTVTNDGNVTLTDVTISDPKLGALSCTPAQPATLAPGGELTCTGSYTVTQADLNAGKVDNSSYARGTPPFGPDVMDHDDETVPGIQRKALSLVKSAAPATYGAVGDVVSYGYLVTNTGNVRLEGPVAVADDKASVSCPNVNTVGDHDSFLDPGEMVTCTASHTISQADLNAGSVTNVAKASAGGIDSNEDSETVTAVQTKALSLEKSASPTSAAAVGQMITYSYVVENTGNVRLAGPVTVADDKAAVSCPALSTIGNGDSFLDPGESVTCSASYSIGQADQNAGSVTNTAKASAGGVDSPEDKATVTITPPPAPPAPPAPPGPPTSPAPPAPPAAPAPKTIDLSIVKTDRPDPVFVGGRLTYTLAVRNAGPDTATNVSVADPLPAGTRFVSVRTTQGSCSGGPLVTCNLGTIAPAGRVLVTIVVRALETGALINTATVVGNEAEANTANNSSSAPTLVRGPFRPPVVTCPALNVQPRTLSLGKKGVVKALVTRAGKGVRGVRIVVSGPGLRKAATTDGRGRVGITVRPPRAGIATIRMASEPSRCSTRRVGVVGVFQPPSVTG